MIFIPVLFLINIVATVFIIHESGSYYCSLYSGNLSWIGWVPAILAEVFQHVMIISPGKSEKESKFFIKLAGTIFVLTVIASAYNVYKPISVGSKNTSRENLLISTLQKEIVDNRKDQKAFSSKENLQKVNAAISVNSRRKSSNELKQLLRKQIDSSSGMSWFEILHLFLVRLALQISALACSWKIGQIFRDSFPTKPKQGKPLKKVKIIKRWRAKYLPKNQNFVGVLLYDNGLFVSVVDDKKKSYKTWNGAVSFFDGTKFEGKIPDKPTKIEKIDQFYARKHIT